ncbi:Alpha/beta hydrolase family protein [Cohnella sp. OV330]|uniref:alpha/beta hydrolase family protein n=1 Tax=Cohnella sp. OV330 TaxID=1855288 RepID=UPI0008E8CAD2|nr:alpha/beta fold hydrolase [Cohnella sp. OV330]SFA73610.1 Alpha/beta hydrolase family protein [Cohnella sp. OV330]
MRPFEIVLLVANLLALLSVLGPKRSNAVRLGLAGANVAALAVHGAVEGFRGQMTLSYAFVALFAIYAAASTKIRMPVNLFARIVKGAVVSLSFLCLAFTALFAHALPVFKLPAPTGDYDVGVRYAYLTDERRVEPFLKDASAKRQLAIKIYYPATRDADKPYAAYFHDSPGLVEAFAAGYRMPAFLFKQLPLVKTHSQEGVPVSDRQASYPVVLFSHGGGTTMEAHVAQCEDLASHGYIVVAVDHTYVASAAELQARVVTDRDATASFDEGDPLAAITQIMADDDSFVIGELAGMNAGKSGDLLAGKLNLQAIGVVGHSLGGAAAYNLAVSDPRIKAAVNLDGAVNIAPDASKRTAPLLMLANDEFHVQAIAAREPLMKKWADMPDDERQAVATAYGSQQAYEEIYERQRLAIAGLADTLKAAGNLYSIEGSAHMKMSDIGLYIGTGFRRFIGINGSTSSEQCLAIVRAATLTFLDQQLKHEPDASMESVLHRYPKLHREANL